MIERWIWCDVCENLLVYFCVLCWFVGLWLWWCCVLGDWCCWVGWVRLFCCCWMGLIVWWGGLWEYWVMYCWLLWLWVGWFYMFLWYDLSWLLIWIFFKVFYWCCYFIGNCVFVLCSVMNGGMCGWMVFCCDEWWLLVSVFVFGCCELCVVCCWLCVCVVFCWFYVWFVVCFCNWLYDCFFWWWIDIFVVD